MQILDELITFFGVDRLESVQTFPEFMLTLIYVLMAVVFSVFLFRCVCSLFAKIEKIGR